MADAKADSHADPAKKAKAPKPKAAKKLDPKTLKGPDFWQKRIDRFEELYKKQEEEYKSKSKPMKLKLLDGKEMECESWVTTPIVLAKKISSQLPDRVFVAKIGETLWDLTRVVEDSQDGQTIEFLDWESTEAQHMFWHSSAHILGAAMEWKYGAKLSTGPFLPEGGFFYEADTTTPVSEVEYQDIDALVKDVTSKKYPFQRLVLSKADALELFEYNKFKHATLADKVPENGFCSVYRCGPLIDPCRGPHVNTTGRVKAMMVTKNSSSYWRNKDTNPVLQRIYGISFPKAAQLDEWKKIMAAAEENDHRKIGTRQGLWMFNELSPGSCFWYPAGAHIYNRLTEWMRVLYRKHGFNEVISPNMYNKKLWETSGHWKHYSEDMFQLKGDEKTTYALKPMNCPGHCVMFSNNRHSYKEFPVRYADFGVLHRNELQGALSGLTRVRRFCQDDAHIFCLPEQTTEEIEKGLQFLEQVYTVLGFKFHLALSTRPEGKLGTDKMWDRSEHYLRVALNKFCNIQGEQNDPFSPGKTFEYNGTESCVKRLKRNMADAEKAGTPLNVKQLWFMNEGDGAFYGPKIDIRIEDAMKRKHQLGTLQLDFNLPQRFDLSYEPKKSVEQPPLKEGQLVNCDGSLWVASESDPNVDTEGNPKEHALSGDEAKKAYVNGEKRPVMIHRAILGSLERCIAILAEHWQGKWPFWVSPKQAIIIPVSEGFMGYAKEVKDFFYGEGFEVALDTSDATLNKKIRNAQMSQYNFIMVVGADEQANKSVNIRVRGSGKKEEEDKKNSKDKKADKEKEEKVATLVKSLDETLAWFQELNKTQDPSM
eukprot:TRINITY_DN3043_c0_g1_i1.p1 TRINITY_DN3043_c0_g1~~TRINITY_DN3043_c0_g1_i1.p1  ORF type:complete len:821 (+),score=276.01 TRINITY_DN3043_c0_g1_i1:42-2504(+)